MKYAYIVVFVLVLVITSCKSNDDNEIIMNKVFYESYYNENIFPRLEQFKEELELLKQFAEDFKVSNSQAHYDAITTQWLVATKAYTKAEVYNFGLIKERFFDINIYNYPINITEIENNILEDTTFDANYFNGKGSVVKGLATLEYLLFEDFNTENARMAFLNDPSRIDYFLGVNNELISEANSIIDTWQTEYFDVYINADETLCSSNAKCLTINQIINVLDVAKVTKIGKPAGFEKSDNITPNNLEAYRSRNSLVLIEAMLNEVRHVYSTSDANIADLVNNIDDTNQISKQVENKFNTLEQEITKFNSNLYDGITTDPELLRPIYDALKELIILFSVDITSILSVTVLPTDNDGD